MDSLLLTTKVRIPPVPPHTLSRARLSNALERVIPEYKLSLLSAPAGSGKTTLLAQWARASRFPVAWLSLSEEDNDRERFLRYLLAAWETVQPGVRETPVGLLLGSVMPNSEAVLTAFINVASDLPGQTVFVLDDYHLISEPAVHEAMRFLLDHLPPALHFVLAGRGQPPLPLARYRTRQELMELRAGELQFLPEETAAFLKQKMGLDLPQDEIARLHTQLEGWIAGLQLAALSLRQGLTPASELVIGGQHRFIADYLSQDVLAYLPEGVRPFLLQTSILDRLCGSLCDAVTGRQDSQGMLEFLERENLFLTPLGDSRQWYRYHRLFADFLRHELNRRFPDEVSGCHRRAARWYLAQDQPEQAFHHAAGGGDAELVVQIFERYIQVMFTSGEFTVVKRWLDRLPEAWHFDYPMIGFVRTGYLLLTGQLDACVHCLEQIEQRLVSAAGADVRSHLARVSAVRCSIACMQNDLARAERFAVRAVRDLPDGDHLFRALTYGSLGDAYRRNARWEDARECYRRLLHFAHTPALRTQAVHTFGALADLDLKQGHLRDAAGYWREALGAIRQPENWGRLPLPLTGWVYIRLGEILYEWNDLEATWKHLSRGLERAELGGDVRARIAGYLLAGRVKLAQGDVEAAGNYLEQARSLVENAQFPGWRARFQRFQLEYWLAQDRLRAAVQWADTMLADEAPAEQPESEVTQLALARLLIVKGDGSSLTQAQALLAGLLPAAEEAGRTGVQIETLALQALAEWRRDERAAAMTSLERALRLAEPEGYLRLFTDLGLPMARLLQESRTRNVMPDYVASLLASFGGELTLPALAEVMLPEPLTPREQEVLELLAAGLTNREIAEKLVISPETVKKHTLNIYAKLAVHGRRQAVTRARELALLD